MTYASCPVCGSTNPEHLHTTPPIPMSIMRVTANEQDSLSIPSLPVHLYSCPCCLHVFNASYDERMVSYTHGGCKMFNNGDKWAVHISDLQAYVNSKIYDSIVEIGSGDGSFLAGISCQDKVAYEPSEEADLCEAKGLKVVRDYFDPSNGPGPGKCLFVMRHVMEHLTSPKDFVEQLTRSCRKPVDMLVEVPNITNAIAGRRVEDWVYEHAQHFTPTSLARLFIRCGWKVYRCETVYNNEVIVLHATYTPTYVNTWLPDQLNLFSTDHAASIAEAKAELYGYIAKGKSIAFWGGSGKSTVFLAQLGIPEARVVDSDPAKAAMCVPGSTTHIEHSPRLINNPVDIIVITTSWRAVDILSEIERLGIKCEKVLVYKQGKYQEVTNVTV